MNWELAFINLIVRTRDIRAAFRKGVSADWFETTEGSAAWESIHHHYKEHGEVPSMQLVSESFPNVQDHESPDNLSAIIERLRGSKLSRDLDELIDEIIDIHGEQGGDRALEVLQHGVSALTTKFGAQDDCIIGADPQAYLADSYRDRRSIHTVPGAPEQRRPARLLSPLSA